MAEKDGPGLHLPEGGVFRPVGFGRLRANRWSQGGTALFFCKLYVV